MLRRIWYYKPKPGLSLPLGMVSCDEELARDLVAGKYACDAESDHRAWPKLHQGKTRRYRRRDMRAENEPYSMDYGEGEED